MSQSSPDVSVLIRCRDEVKSIGSVLTAVLEQRGVAPFEIVVLDCGSRDGTLDLLAGFPVRVEHLPAALFSYGHALNRGTALANGEIVVFLSAHTRPVDIHWLARLVAPFDEADTVAAFGRQIPVAGVNPIEAITTARNFPLGRSARVRFSNANGAVRRGAVLARPFDEEMPIAEDHLWAAGIRDPERIVYVPGAQVLHSHPMTAVHWRSRFYAHGLAAEYARNRYGTELPWGQGEDASASIVLRRALPFLRLAGALARKGELRALARLPAYAVARTVWYARGLREGMRRYASHVK